VGRPLITNFPSASSATGDDVWRRNVGPDETNPCHKTSGLWQVAQLDFPSNAAIDRPNYYVNARQVLAFRDLNRTTGRTVCGHVEVCGNPTQFGNINKLYGEILFRPWTIKRENDLTGSNSFERETEIRLNIALYVVIQIVVRVGGIPEAR